MMSDKEEKLNTFEKLKEAEKFIKKLSNQSKRNLLRALKQEEQRGKEEARERNRLGI